MGLKNKLLEFFKAISSKNITSKGMSSASEKSQNHALDVIEKHEFQAHYYSPGFDYRNDEELFNALDLLSSSGFIITDSEGNIVGVETK